MLFFVGVVVPFMFYFQAITPEAVMEHDHMIFQHDDDVANKQVDDEPEVEVNLSCAKGHSATVMTVDELMETEMMESATMKDVMEKCIAIESDKLVQNIQVCQHV